MAHETFAAVPIVTFAHESACAIQRARRQRVKTTIESAVPSLRIARLLEDFSSPDRLSY
jgi:hypothetical protein